MAEGSTVIFELLFEFLYFYGFLKSRFLCWIPYKYPFWCTCSSTVPNRIYDAARVQVITFLFITHHVRDNRRHIIKCMIRCSLDNPDIRFDFILLESDRENGKDICAKVFSESILSNLSHERVIIQDSSCYFFPFSKLWSVKRSPLR
jgi:hypothetical protein